MRDKIIWVGCISLFGAGFIAGRIVGSSQFFEVDNIHDLFEIAGAAATLVAAVVAIGALGSWRNEFLFAERYKAIRDFHAACKNGMQAYWYVALGYNLLYEIWNNRGSEDWFRNETESQQKKMRDSDNKLNGSLMLLRHYLSNEDFDIVSESYDQYVREVGYGCSELIAFSTECEMMRFEPTDRYDDFARLGDERKNSLLQATTELEIKADELLAKYTRSVR